MILATTHTKAWSKTVAKAMLLAAFVLPAFIQQSSAQSVEPMTFELQPLGKRSSESLRIENPSNRPITVEISATTLELDELGNETNVPADDDFLIYPPQTIVQAGATQIVKVKYIGDPTITTSKAYRVAINQLPVDLRTEEGSSVAILTKFLTVANVAPTKAKPELKVVEIKADADERWLLTVENTGNRYGALSDTSWDLAKLGDPSVTKSLDVDRINEIISRSLVLPKSRLKLTIPAIEGFEPDDTQIKIKYLKKV